MKSELNSKIRVGYIIQCIIILLALLSLSVAIIYYFYTNSIDYTFFFFWVSLFFVAFFALFIADLTINITRSLHLTENKIIETKLFGRIIKKANYSDIIKKHRKKEYSSIRGARITEGYYKTIYVLKNDKNLSVSQNQYSNYREIKAFIQQKLINK